LKGIVQRTSLPGTTDRGLGKNQRARHPGDWKSTFSLPLSSSLLLPFSTWDPELVYEKVLQDPPRHLGGDFDLYLGHELLDWQAHNPLIPRLWVNRRGKSRRVDGELTRNPKTQCRYPLGLRAIPISFPIPRRPGAAHAHDP